MIKTVLLLLLLAGIFAIAYDRGYMAVKSYSAVMFVGSSKGNSAKLTCCNGYLKRIVRFKEDGSYTYRLDTELSRGEVSVELMDPAKEKIMHLDRSKSSAAVMVEKRKKYYLIIRFRSATGRYALLRE